jgi:3-deoxy-D-arabino-heptulosonate 7-phosphate (DAHP) synthase
MSGNAIVSAGSVRFGNTLPLALIAGPCQMESRDHALEMALALKEISVLAWFSRRPLTRPTAPAARASAAWA